MHSYNEPPQLKRFYKRPVVLVLAAIVFVAASGYGAVHFITDTANTSHSQNASDTARNGTTGESKAQGVAFPSPLPSASTTHRKRHRLHKPTSAPSQLKVPVLRRQHRTTPPPVGSASSCTRPKFESSDPHGGWNLPPYFVQNNEWQASGYNVSQTLYACSYSNWYVVATMNNDSGDRKVKSYPNSHRDFDSKPEITSFHSIASTFAETSPHVGIYEDAYDIWINGIATSGSTQLMIWNDNHDQVPAGSVVATASFGGHTYKVWKAGTFITFEATRNFSSGSMNLLTFFKWIMARGWIPANSTLSQIDYGVELISTNNAPARFTFSNFSVTTS
jgi:Glycosyl hydrolase family 12